MSGTVTPQQPLTVTLEARQWNSLLFCAAEGLGALQALFADVQQQCVRQSARPPDERLPEHMPGRVNGAAQEAAAEP